jgi:predicted transcriptional regulator
MPLIPMTPQEQIAQQIVCKRKHSRASQAEVAIIAGTSQTAIARLEAGLGNPTLDLIERVATALDLTITIHVHPLRQTVVN